MRRRYGATPRGADGRTVRPGHRPIEVVSYNQRWDEPFAVSERELRIALAPYVLELEHIGSTAMPGLAAKPVIDIQVGVRTLDASVEIVSAVESLGYEYVPEFEDELPDRRYFRRWIDGRRSHQVHLVERSDTEWWGSTLSAFGTGFERTTTTGIGMRNSS